MKKFILSVILSAAMLCRISLPVFAEDDEFDGPVGASENFGAGFAEMTDEEWQHFFENTSQIGEIKPNETALSRVSTETAVFSANTDTIEIAEKGGEVTVLSAEEAVSGPKRAAAAQTSEFPLASAVDVSQSRTFPAIGNQGTLNNCNAWSLCYYQMTNNMCAARGLEARTRSGESVKQNIMSPIFTYALVNPGENVGTNVDETIDAIISYGCPDINVYDLHEDKDGLNYIRWAATRQAWQKAIYNKPMGIMYGFFTSEDTADAETGEIINIKKILSNGYIVSFNTYADSLVFTTSTTDGKWACRYMNTTKQKAHMMTIVGYDDDYWVDINNNGRHDAGETGAFKVANSWGALAYHYTNGFLWVPYDAFGTKSKVSNASTSRSPVGQVYYYLIPEKTYTPLLTAEVELNTNDRDQIAISFGVSDVTADTPSVTIGAALGNENIAFNHARWSEVNKDPTKKITILGGTEMGKSATIPFDLTPLICKAYKNTGISPGDKVKIYVNVTDCDDNSSSIQLLNVVIKEPSTGKTTRCTPTYTLTTRTNTVTKTANVAVTPFVGGYKNQGIDVNFNADVNPASVNGNIFLVTPDNETVIPEYTISGNKLSVSAPEGGFNEKNVYKLRIGTGVSSVGGNHILSEKVMNIYILDRIY